MYEPCKNYACLLKYPQFSAQRQGFETGRSRRPAPIPQGPGPLPGVAHQDSDRCCFGRHPLKSVGGRETSQPAPAD